MFDNHPEDHSNPLTNSSRTQVCIQGRAVIFVSQSMRRLVSLVDIYNRQLNARNKFVCICQQLEVGVWCRVCRLWCVESPALQRTQDTWTEGPPAPWSLGHQHMNLQGVPPCVDQQAHACQASMSQNHSALANLGRCRGNQRQQTSELRCWEFSSSKGVFQISNEHHLFGLYNFQNICYVSCRIIFSTENPTPLKVRDRSKRGILDAAHDSFTMTSILSKVKHAGAGKTVSKKDRLATTSPIVPESNHCYSARAAEIVKQRRNLSLNETPLGRHTMLSPPHVPCNTSRHGTGRQIGGCRRVSVHSSSDFVSKITSRTKGVEGSCAHQPITEIPIPKTYQYSCEPPWAVDPVHGSQLRSQKMKHSGRQVFYPKSVKQTFRNTREGVGHCLDWR